MRLQDEHSTDGRRADSPAGWPAAGPADAEPGGGDQSRPEPAASGQPEPGPAVGSPAAPGAAGAGQARPEFPASIPPPPPPPGFGQPGTWGYGQQPPPLYDYPQAVPRRRGRFTSLIAYLTVAAVAAAAGAVSVALTNGNSTSRPPSNAGTANPGNGFPFNGTGRSGSQNSGVGSAAEQKVLNAVQPGLVVISSSLRYQADGAEATGMIISGSGLVLTNNHVIDGTTGLTATVVSTGRRYTARWLGYDKSADVAVIQLEGASGLRAVPLGNSDSAKVGDGVVAMGNANGTGRISTVTGRITGLDKSITASDQSAGSAEHLTGMIQTNAGIVSGDSGGPLANTSGQVIAMDTAASANTLGLGQRDVGFAIPINRALSIAQQIISGKASSSVRVGPVGFLGIIVTGGRNGQQSTLASPRAQARQEQQQQQQQGGAPFGSPGSGCLANANEAAVPARIAPAGSGTLVLGSLCNTPAAAAGMVPGDVITNVNGHAVSSPVSLVTILSALKAGQAVRVDWVTPGGATVDRTMTLVGAPPQ
jgi:S1-C subfamily serine protease